MKKSIATTCLVSSVFLSLAVSTGACVVPKKQYDDKVMETDNCYKALQTENNRKKELAAATAQLQAQLDDLTKALADAKGNATEIERLRADLQASASAVERLQTEKAELEKKSETYDQLVSSLKTEIDQGQIKIREAQGRLSVDLIDKILFDSGSVTIKPAGEAALRKVAAVLRTVKDKEIMVEGHTDSVDIHGELLKTYPTNWELSAARSTTVVRFLEDAGVDPYNLGVAGFSKFKPVADNQTEQGKSQNRRIEIVLTPKIVFAK